MSVSSGFGGSISTYVSGSVSLLVLASFSPGLRMGLDSADSFWFSLQRVINRLSVGDPSSRGQDGLSLDCRQSFCNANCFLDRGIGLASTL